MSSGANGIKAGRAYVELGVHDKLAAGLKTAAAKLKHWGESISNIGEKFAKLGGMIAAPMLLSAKSFASTGSELMHMSQRTGISVEALSEMSFAASQCGVEMQGLEKGIMKMQKTIFQAAMGSSSANEALGMLGLTVKDLDNLSPDQQFKKIADRISKISDPTIRAAMAMQIFGKSGTALLPIINVGAEGMEALRRQAAALGLTISTEDAESAHKFERAMEVLWKVLKQGIFVIGSALAPTLRDLTKWMTGVVVSTVNWLRQNRELVLSVFKFAAGILAGGLAIVVLGKAIVGLGALLGAISTAFTLIGGVVGVIGAILAWMITPIGLVIASLAALAGYMIYSTGAGGKALDWLGERFGELKDDAMQSYQGIADALAAGDIGLAAKILWLTLKMEWQKGVAWVSAIWNDCLLWLEKRGVEAFYGLVMGLEVIWHGLEVAWIETTAFLSQVWTGFCAAIQIAWNWCGKVLQKAWNKIKGVFDENFDSKTANEAIEKQFQESKDQIWNEAKKQVGEREQQRKNERDKEQQTHEGTMNELTRQGEEKKKQFEDESKQKNDGNKDEVAKAKKEWQDAIKEAGDKRKAKESGGKGGPGSLEGPEGIIDQARKGAMGLGSLMEMSAKKTAGVRGTFNAAEAGAMGSNSATDRIAKATEDTAKNTKKLLDKAGDGLEFE